MIPYKQILNQIILGSVISFKEYTVDRREKKHLTISIENSVVHEVIPPNTPIGRELLEQYYGTELSDQDYLQLSSVNCARIILLIGINEQGQNEYKPILFNQDYYELGLQEIEVINGLNEEPVYTQLNPVRVPINFM